MRDFWRYQPRDRFGRWTDGIGTATSALGGAGSAASFYARKHRPRYVKGSFTRNLYVGQGGSYKGAKVGAEFRTPGGRGVIVKGIAGYHGKPDRRLDVTPSYNKAARAATVTAKPNPRRKPRPKPSGTRAGASATASSAAKAKAASAGQQVRTGPADPLDAANAWVDKQAANLAKAAVEAIPGAGVVKGAQRIVDGVLPPLPSAGTAAGTRATAQRGSGLRASSAGRKIRW